MQEDQTEQDFGIPGEPRMESASEPEGWPSKSDWNRVEATITQAPDKPENVKLTGVRKTLRTKSKVKTTGDLTPLLNALAVEIEETMGLLEIATGRDRRTDILCRKVGASLMRIENIRDRIVAAVED
jgi:hypothetical protein